MPFLSKRFLRRPENTRLLSKRYTMPASSPPSSFLCNDDGMEFVTKGRKRWRKRIFVRNEVRIIETRRKGGNHQNFPRRKNRARDFSHAFTKGDVARCKLALSKIRGHQGARLPKINYIQGRQRDGYFKQSYHLRR